MKKIVLTTMMILGLVGCGPLGCDSEPPARATLDENGGYGMRYHFTIYDVTGDANPHAIRCTSYEYITSEIYTDDLGIVNGSQVIWKNKLGGSDMETEEKMKELTFTFSQQLLRVDGYKNEYTYLNISYKVETSSPDSWGVPISSVQIRQ